MGKLSATLTPQYAGCKFGALLEKHADAEDLATIADPRVKHAAIAEFATQEWGPVSDKSVALHRAGKCMCARAN